MDIRPVRTSDREAVQSLWASSGLGDASEKEWDVLVEGGCASLLVAEDGGQVVGAAVVAYDGWRAFIYHLAVSAVVRRQGVGSALMAEAERRLREKGARLVHGHVDCC